MNAKLLVVTIAISVTHAYNIDMENVQGRLRKSSPAFVMLEHLLSLEDENECIEKMFCLMETETSLHANNPLKYYSRYLTNKFEDIDPAAFKKVKDAVAEYPRVSRVVDAIKVGQRNRTSDSCAAEYPQCLTENSDLEAVVKMFDDDSLATILHSNHTLVKRSFCEDVNLICKVAKGGCLICAAVTGGACGLLCGTGRKVTCTALKVGCYLNNRYG